MMPAAICWHSRLVRRRLATTWRSPSPGSCSWCSSPPRSDTSSALPLCRISAARSAPCRHGTRGGRYARPESVDGARPRRPHGAHAAPPASGRPPPPGRGLCSRAALLAAALPSWPSQPTGSPRGHRSDRGRLPARLHAAQPVTPLSMIAGAISGALPPVSGWAAANGRLGSEPGCSQA